MLQPEPSSPIDEETPYLKSQHVQWEHVRVADLPTMWTTRSERKKYAVVDGDLLVCEGGDVGRAAIVYSAPDGTIIQNALHRVRPQRENEVGFLLYVLAHAASQGWFEIICNKSTIAHFTVDKFGALGIALPPPAEQKTIVAFLDRETGRADRLVAKKQELIERLKEKRTALISRTVTHGLPPTAARIAGLNPHPKLKPSGVEWLGEVPEHWVVCKLSRVTILRCDGPFGSGLKSEHYSDEGVRVIRLQNIRSASFDDTDKAFIEPDYYRELGDHDVHPGDVLIAGLGDDRYPVGRACVAPATLGPAMVKADCFRFRLDARKVDAAFAALQLSAVALNLSGALATGTTRGRMNLSVTANRAIALPSLKEQHAIADYLDRETAKIDRMVEKVEAAIGRLQEYRTALITAAVTGKIDVRGVKPDNMTVDNGIPPSSHDSASN